MKTEIIILIALAAGAFFWFRRKDATENLGPTEDITPDGGAVSMDAVPDYNGANMTREQQIEAMIDAVGAAGRSQMAASTGGYAAVVSAFENVDTTKLTYEQRSQMAASQNASAVIRAQVVGKAISAPVKSPVTKKSSAVAGNMQGLKAVSQSALDARKKALLDAQKKQTKVKNASLMAQAKAVTSRATLEAQRIAALIPKPAIPSAVARTASEVRGAAAVAAAMKPSFNSETGQTSVIPVGVSRNFGFEV